MYKMLSNSREGDLNNSLNRSRDMLVQKKKSIGVSPVYFDNVRFRNANTPIFPSPLAYEQNSPRTMLKNNPNDFGVIQMVRVMQDPYYRSGRTPWTSYLKYKDFKHSVEIGLQMAQDQLSKAENNKNMPAVLKNYAKDVLRILNKSELKIYPLFESDLGRSAFGELAISMNVYSHILDSQEAAKTLIHEAFHLIGGCWNIVYLGNGKAVHQPRADEVSCTDTNVNVMISAMAGKNLEDINADTFAQLIMQL